jgi:hypothetical protein
MWHAGLFFLIRTFCWTCRDLVGPLSRQITLIVRWIIFCKWGRMNFGVGPRDKHVFFKKYIVQSANSHCCIPTPVGHNLHGSRSSYLILLFDWQKYGSLRLDGWAILFNTSRSKFWWKWLLFLYEKVKLTCSGFPRSSNFSTVRLPGCLCLRRSLG